MPKAPSTLPEAASWLVNTSIDDARSSARNLKPGKDSVATLNAAIAHEETHQKRTTLLAILNAALKRCTAAPVIVAVIPPEQVLADLRTHLETCRDAIIRLEENFHKASLGSRLQIGLHCLKAYQVFADVRPASERGKQGGRPSKTSSQREEVSTEEGPPTSFSAWLKVEAPWLKEPTAYKYMTAVKGLQLDHTATERQVAQALKKLGNPSLKALCDAAPVAVEALPAPAPQLQGEFSFLRDALVHLREQDEALAEVEEQLKANPEMLKVASARVYSMLHRLTGTHWEPSDHANDLAEVDPDNLPV